ncbi:uncharacterized protein LOC122535300 [Frieseomelitta varia]|uniref:uncharacterized protein LOC122535300 n=1 Tax=Frieseomelitta varia TaxID=561572 RepID=UPI001CB6A590|nr:uncharacterized protein LOC122535300 [Frieseomelitta varia]
MINDEIPTMTQLTVCLLAIFLVSYTVADIIVQPGYEHSKKYSTQQRQSITQPSEIPQHSEYTNIESNPHQSQEEQQGYTDPGYHLELHPVYSDAYHIPAEALPPIYPNVALPPMSKSAYRRLLSNYGAAGVPVIPHHYEYPLPVHNRYRRSDPSDEPDATRKDNHDEDDVATKSSLDDSLSVVDLQNQDKKRVNTRQSVTLLGLNPSNMYPVQQQYRSAELNPTYDSNQKPAGSQQTPSQINARETQQQQAATFVQATAPRTNNENLHHALLLQQPAHQQFRVSDLRNYPDVRPVSPSLQSSRIETMKGHSEPQTFTPPKREEASGQDEIVGTKLGNIYKIKVHQHMHRHGKLNGLRPLENPIIADTETPTQQVVKIYDKPIDNQAANYLQNVQYNVIPQTYPVSNSLGSNVDNYVWPYPCSSLSSPIRICFESNDAQPIMYQLA